MIFDCCSVLPLQVESTGNGVILALSATGFERDFSGSAPGPGTSSFTHALVDELAKKANAYRSSSNCPPISDVQLHGALVTRLSAQTPSVIRGENGEPQQTADFRYKFEIRRRTPHYQFLSSNKYAFRWIICRATGLTVRYLTHLRRKPSYHR